MQELCKKSIKSLFAQGILLSLFLFLNSLIVTAVDFSYDNPTLPKLLPEETTGTTLIEGANYSINTNRSDYWDDLDTPADIALGDLDGAEQQIWDWSFIQLVNVTKDLIESLGFVPYTGATADVDLGTHDLTVDDITADNIYADDLDITNDVEVGGVLYVNETTEHSDSVYISKNDSVEFEIETTDSYKSSEIHVLADGTNDLYIYTYGSNVSGSYYGLPKGNTSLIDARGQRFVVGTFDDSPMYLATSKDPRWIITEDGDLIPFDDDFYNMGNETNRITNIYLVGEDGSGGLHFVEDDTSQGNLTMDDDFNLLWNGAVIVNALGNVTYNANDAVDSSELDNICGVDGNILLRTDGTWDCAEYQTGLIGSHLNYTKVINDNIIELRFLI